MFLWDLLKLSPLITKSNIMNEAARAIERPVKLIQAILIILINCPEFKIVF